VGAEADCFCAGEMRDDWAAHSPALSSKWTKTRAQPGAQKPSHNPLKRPLFMKMLRWAGLLQMATGATQPGCGNPTLSDANPEIVARKRTSFKLSSNDASKRVSEKRGFIEKFLDNP
jgi:hypothetical protein